MKRKTIVFLLFAIILLIPASSDILAAEYVAFSLKVARERIVSTPNSKDYRKLHPEVFTIGGITAIRGLVYDRKNKDVILVGERDPERSVLTLDDFVVALRARFIHGKWPLVSIDPTPETKETNMQIARFEGGIEDTRFGKDFLNAQCLLRQLAEGVISSGIDEVKSYSDLIVEETEKYIGHSYSVNIRFWFYPVLPTVTTKEDVIAIRELNLEVFTEVPFAEIDGERVYDHQDPAGERFAKGVTDNFEELAKIYPSFSRLQGLSELILVTRAIEKEELDKRPDFSFWLNDYRIEKVTTEKKINISNLVEEYELSETKVIYGAYKEFRDSIKSMSIVSRYKSGDTWALTDAVLETRTSYEAISWSFVIEEDRLLTATEVKVVPTAEVTRPEERMKTYPSPGEYVAFSLKVAQKMIMEFGTGENYRVLYPEVSNLGGINKIHGLVYDRDNDDIILVGKYDPKRQPLTLDDFVVALRARFIHGKWPLVSIDPPETKKTNMQIVRFEGGIEDTQFGQDLFDADYRLKRIGMGLLLSGVPGLKSHWDLAMERAKKHSGSGGGSNIGLRFWFYPVLPSVSVRKDVVAIRGLKVGVFTKVFSAEIDGKKIENLSTFQDQAGDMFAKGVSDNFEELSEVHPSFSRVQGLDELVALTRAMEEMDEKPDLSFWLRDYNVREVRTKKELHVLRRKEEYRVSEAEVVYTGYLEFSGGVELRAIALRLKAGDVTALKDAVIETKPKPDALTWRFVVGEWLISTSAGIREVEDIALLFVHALFLQRHKRYDDAITLYGKIIELKPDCDVLYHNRGTAYAEGKGDYDRAISDYNKALAINPRLVESYIDRGSAYDYKGLYNKAISDFDKALKINPRNANAFYNRGVAYRDNGKYDLAIRDFNRAIEIAPRFVEANCARGYVYYAQERYDQAVTDYNKAIEINPRYAQAYNNRGLVYQRKGEYDRAISDYNRAIEIDPESAMTYNNRAIIYCCRGQYNQAITDYDKAIQIDPRYAEAYYNRGLCHESQGQHVTAIEDFNKAIEIKPRFAEAYRDKARACEKVGRVSEAIEAYEAFVQYASP